MVYFRRNPKSAQPEADPSQPKNWLIRPLADFGGNLKSKIILGDSAPHSTILELSSSKNWWLQ